MKEFISRQKAMTQSSSKWMIGYSIVFFGILFCSIPLSRYAEQHEHLKWLEPVFGIGLFVFLIGNFPLLIWFAKRQQRRFGILCPNCSKPLIGLSAQIAISTGHCGHCGESVFSDTKAD